MYSAQDLGKKNLNTQLPHKDVVNALFESYLSIRKLIEANKPIQLVTSSKNAGKIETCLSILEKVQAAKNFEDWINIVYLCADKENIEKGQHASAWFFGITRFFVDKPLLLLTIHAACAYILSQLKQNNKFPAQKDGLETQITVLKNAITEATNYHAAQSIIEDKKTQLKEVMHQLDTLNMLENYHNAFFLDIILPRETQATELGEKSFDDYANNVLSGKRQLILYRTLLRYSDKNGLDQAKETRCPEENVKPGSIEIPPPKGVEHTLFSRSKNNVEIKEENHQQASYTTKVHKS